MGPVDGARQHDGVRILPLRGDDHALGGAAAGDGDGKGARTPPAGAGQHLIAGGIAEKNLARLLRKSLITSPLLSSAI